uniref:uncharacterized protein si:ch211-199g17.2 isoform X1 n=1 Tax=Solea senegalensis TaxID=28829 RepID=UPI001CD89C1D|nr:uncharacterized protein si:ch211-199g17.2 isoform X1 [Solea senegalensis]XP_043909336.1 uncharacterized protein si:ch211-199g17.2 isoform X1 [Solea senegalensis]
MLDSNLQQDPSFAPLLNCNGIAATFYNCSMQSSEAQKAVSSKSELFESLKVYLTNRKRLQPIIGLGSIVECVKVGAHSREVLYLCAVCVCRLGKADMRNHIMGSLHRYNYIKAWHPHLLSEWKENSDLSKLAWPLMEIAKKIEGKEGVGEVQLFEVEGAVFQRMATLSERDAVTFLRDCQGQPERNAETPPVQLKESPIQSQRIVLLGQNQQQWTEKSIKAEFMHDPPLMQSAVAPHMKTEGCLRNTSAPQLDSCSFLNVYTGTKPIIGLFCVVECRSDNGHTCVFLCHCCRIRFNKKDINVHLTSSSHLNNYLMETHPEQVEILLEDNYEPSEFLQSLARKVEREEGRGELKVINVPESLCIQMTGKSYHWCIKMLCSSGTQTSSQTNKITLQDGDMPDKHAVMLSKWAQKGKKTNTVFKVSLPLKRGALLLERMSFCEDDFPMVQSPASGVSPSLENLTEDKLDYDAGSFEITHTEHNITTLPQPDLYSRDTHQYMEAEINNTDTWYQEVDSYFANNEYLSQSEDKTWTDQKAYQESNNTRQYGSQETSGIKLEKDLKNENPQNVGWSHALSHTQDWSSYNFPHGQEGVYTQQWYGSASQNTVGTSQKVSRDDCWMEMSSDAPQLYQQLPQNQYMAPDHNNYQTGCVGHHGSSAEVAPPYVDSARINMCPYLGAVPAQIAPEIIPHAPETEQRQMYMAFMTSHVQTTPQSYMMQPVACQAIQIDHRGMHNPNYYHEPTWHVPDPHNNSSSGGGGWDLPQSSTLIPPVQSTYYGSYFE